MYSVCTALVNKKQKTEAQGSQQQQKKRLTKKTKKRKEEVEKERTYIQKERKTEGSRIPKIFPARIQKAKQREQRKE